MTGIVQTLIGSFGAAAAAVTDAYFYLVTLLLPGNGTNGAQNNTFLDSSSSPLTITRNGNTTQGTFSPFSQTGWSNYFGASSDKLVTGTMTALGSDFTLEGWIYTPSSFVDYNIIWDNRASDADSAGFLFTINSAGKLIFFANSSFQITTTTVLNKNSWYHVALVRSGSGSGNCKIYINGVADATTATYTTSFTRTVATIGNNWGGSGYNFNGYISNLRATTGALYTSTFTPSTSPLTTTVSAGTCVLLTCQSNRFIDNSASAVTITPTGASVQAFSPFAPTAAYSAATNGGSGYFDGNGDYLTSSGDFFSGQGTARTFQCWIYVVSLPGSGTSQGIFSGANSGGNLSLRYDSSGALKLDNTGTVEIATSASGAIKTGQWTHVALTRTTGNLYTLYVNGSSVGSGTNSTNMGSSTYLASLTGGSTLNGYMTDVRVTNTVETINVPTAPLTAISGTALLLNFTNAGITDATAKNDLETVGGAQISTTQSKFGGSSMYFDGTGDYLPVPASQNFAFRTGDFTIEAWIYLANTTGDKVITDTRNSNGNTTTGFSFSVTGTALKIYTNADTSLGGTLASGSWYHIALVRFGSGANNLKAYINGTATGTSATVTNDFSDTALTIGAVPGGSVANFNGYIDDLRITKGYARYTSNFTAPTAAFPVQ